MPTWDKADFDAQYESRINGEVVHYDRRWLYALAQTRAAKIVPALGLTPSDRVLVIGCGLGWLCEMLETEHGIESAGTEISPWLWSVKDTDPEKYAAWPKMVAEDSSTETSRQAAAAQLSAWPTWVIVEDLAAAFTDAELTGLASAFEGYVTGGAQIAHIVTPYRQQQQIDSLPDFNWKTVPDWRAFLDSLGLQHHKILPTGSYEVV